MNNQEILDNAPEGATHVDTEGDYHKIETIYQYEDKSDCGYEDRFRLSNSGDWVTDSDDLLLTRSLADIARIAELEEIIRGRDELINNAVSSRIAELEMHIQSLKAINKYIDEGRPDMQVVRSEIGEVISRAEGTYLKAPKEQGE